jgi:hypothetical protein
MILIIWNLDIYIIITAGSAPLNGPATEDNQCYRWHIGLGADYPAISSVGSYGMQFFNRKE